MAGSEAQENDVLYHITISPWNKMEVSITEYRTTKETTKSLMVDDKRFSKDMLDKPFIDHYMGHFYKGTMTMYECTKEDVEEFGVPKLKNEVREWLTQHRDYYDKYLKELDKDEQVESHSNPAQGRA